MQLLSGGRVETKKCSLCEKKKILSEFKKEKKVKSGRSSWCKKCANAKNREWYQKNPNKKKEYYQSQKGKRNYYKSFLKTKYNLSIEEYDQMFEQQNGVCAICRKIPVGRRLGIDHNHKTGKIRGLLCNHCNFLLSAWENKEFSSQIKKYLKFYDK